MAGPPLLTVRLAARHLAAAKVIAYPTEAVYGLGCDPASEAAVRHVLELKQRPIAAGLILVADRFEWLRPYSADCPEHLLRRARASWPGPVTWLFPRGRQVPDWLAGNHATVALRVTAHPVCRALCAAFGGAIVSTSANPSARPAARSAAEVGAYFDGRIAGIVRGELGGHDRPSEIRDLATGAVLRAGG